MYVCKSSALDSPCPRLNTQSYRGNFILIMLFIPSHYTPLRAVQSPADKGLIVSGAEVQRGVCSGLRAGLPSSVFLSEIFEWDQTVIRSKLTQKHTQTHIVCARACARAHTHATLSSLAVSGLWGGVGSGKWKSSCEWGHTKGSE